MSALEVYTPVRVTRSVLTRQEALDVPVGRGTVETPRATVKVKEKDFFSYLICSKLHVYLRGYQCIQSFLNKPINVN